MSDSAENPDKDRRYERLDAKAVRRRFDRAAADFHRADFVHRHAARGMLERMAPMRLDARRVLDAGSAAGAASRVLAKRFRRSRVISIDASLPMLRRAKASRSRFSRIIEMQADATRPPLVTGSIDLVFANMLLPWIDDVQRFFGEIARILRPGGLFVFSSLGPDSLEALRDAWQTVDDLEHVMVFADMHDVGDALLSAGLRDPVLDVEYLTVSYDSVSSLFADLTNTGARNCLRGRRQTLTGRIAFARVRRSLEERFRDGILAVPIELVFGHAWGGGPPRPAGEFSLDVREIGHRRRRLSP